MGGRRRRCVRAGRRAAGRAWRWRNARRGHRRDAQYTGSTGWQDAGRISSRRDGVRAMAGRRAELPLLREARVVRDLLRGCNALRGRREARATATAKPGIRCVLGTAARATHPVTSVTYLDRPRLITSRDPVGPCDTLARYGMMPILDRVLLSTWHRGGPPMSTGRPVLLRSTGRGPSRPLLPGRAGQMIHDWRPRVGSRGFRSSGRKGTCPGSGTYQDRPVMCPCHARFLPSPCRQPLPDTVLDLTNKTVFARDAGDAVDERTASMRYSPITTSAWRIPRRDSGEPRQGTARNV